jgi:hypothetical protein
MTDAEEQEAYAQRAFGRGWHELIPLFSAGLEEYEKMNASWHVVSDDNLKKLTDMDDEVQKMSANWETLQNTFLATLASTLTPLLEKLNTFLEKFNAYLESDEGQQKMEEFGNALSGLFEGLLELDPEAVMDAIKAAIDGIVGAFQWIDEHKGEIVQALKAIGEAFIGMKLLSFATNLAQIVANFWTLKAGGFFANGANAAGAAGAGSAAPGVVALPGMDATAQGVMTGWSGSKLLNFMGPLAAVTAWDQAVNAPLRDGWKAKRAELEQRSKETGMSAADLLAADTLEMTPEQYAQWKLEGERIGTSGGRAFTPPAPVYEGGTFREEVFGGRMYDLLASSGIGKNSLTSDDITEFRGLPAMIAAAARQGIESANIQVVIQDDAVQNLTTKVGNGLWSNTMNLLN